MKPFSQKGFSVVEFLIITLVLAVIGLAGYMVYDRQQNKNATTELSQVSDSTGAPEIKDADDLKSAEAVLEQTDTSSTADAAQLDSDLNSF